MIWNPPLPILFLQNRNDDMSRKIVLMYTGFGAIWVLKTRQIEKRPKNSILANLSKIVRRFQKCKALNRAMIASGKKHFFSPFLMRKPLSSGQNWFLRPYFPQIHPDPERLQ